MNPIHASAESRPVLFLKNRLRLEDNRVRLMLNEMRPYLLRGKVEQDFTALTLTVNGIEFLDRHNQEHQQKGKYL